MSAVCCVVEPYINAAGTKLLLDTVLFNNIQPVQPGTREIFFPIVSSAAAGNTIGGLTVTDALVLHALDFALYGGATLRLGESSVCWCMLPARSDRCGF